MRARSSTASTLPALTPMKTSAPVERVGQLAALAARVGALRQVALGAGRAGRRPARGCPRGPTRAPDPAPASSSRCTIAVPAAPPPATTIFTSGRLLVHDPQRVLQRGQRDDRRPVLVVVEDRDVELLAQPGLDLEAAGGGDVLEVDAAEAGGDELDGAHDLVDVLGVEADRPGVDVAEPLEQRGLALHHRHRRAGPDVAQAQDGGAVGDDGDGVALDRQPADVLGVIGQRQADPGDAGRVGHRQVVAGLERHPGGDLDLAAEVQQEGAVADLAHLHAGHVAQRLDHLLGVRGVGGRAGDVDGEPVGAAVYDVDGGHRAAGGADGGRDAADAARGRRRTVSRTVIEYEAEARGRDGAGAGRRGGGGVVLMRPMSRRARGQPRAGDLLSRALIPAQNCGTTG